MRSSGCATCPASLFGPLVGTFRSPHVLRAADCSKTMKTLIALLATLCAAPLAAGALAQPPRVGTECVEPFVTGSGYVLTPSCPPKALLALAQDDPLNLRPSLDPDAPRELDGEGRRREPLRIYEQRVPGTEIFITP